MKLKIKDSTLDYFKAAKNLDIEGDIVINVPYHTAELDIVDWPIEFTNSVRFILNKLHPVTRLNVTITEHTDPRIMKDLLEKRINDIVISSKCPLQPFKYELIHAHSFDNPLNITLLDSSIGKYINKSVVGVLDKGRRIKIEGEVIRTCALDFNNIRFDFSTMAIRKFNEFQEYDVDGLTYNKGIYRFTYEDDISANEVMKNVFGIFKKIIQELKTNLDKYLEESVDIPFLTINGDRSCILAVCVKHYIYKESPPNIKQIQQAYSKTQDKTGSIIEFRMTTIREIKPYIEKGLAKLIKDIELMESQC